MPYSFSDQTGDIGVTVTAPSLPALFASAAAAFTDSITAIDGVEPKRPEEVDLDAPELDLLLVHFLSELLYRFDTRGWLSRTAALDVREKDGGWALEGTLTGERLDPTRHPIRILITAVTYHALHIDQQHGTWTANVVFVI